MHWESRIEIQKTPARQRFSQGPLLARGRRPFACTYEGLAAAMIFMAHKFVSVTGKSSGAGPRAVSSLPLRLLAFLSSAHTPLCLLRGQAVPGGPAGIRGSGSNSVAALPSSPGSPRRRRARREQGQRVWRRRGAVAAVLALWQWPSSRDLWGSCAHSVVRRPRGGKQPLGGSLVCVCWRSSSPLPALPRRRFWWQGGCEATLLGQCQ